MTDEVEIEIVAEGSEDDPFAAQTAAGSSTDASTGADADEGADSSDDAQTTDTTTTSTEDDELTPDEQAALDILKEEARLEAEKTVTSQLQSRYDRQFAAQNRQIQELTKASEARERELLEALREAKLNGLTDEEKAKLQAQWNHDDEVSKLDAYRTELDGYQVELLRTAYAVEYAEFGLLAEDLEVFSTPEEMEQFIKDVQIEYYKLLAERGPEAKTDTPAAPAKPAAKAPAGATAPTDAGSGGGAPPPTTKFNSNRGMSAMADNIRSGWETPRKR